MTETFKVRGLRFRIPPQVGIPMALALAIFLLGPRVQVDDDVAPLEVPIDVDAYLERVESSVPDIRPGDAKQVVWADPETRAATPLAVVYLHGFGADRHEIDPFPQRLARRLGANLFLTRLTGHGRDGEAMAEATAEDWLRDVAEALAVGRRIGERVVVVGTSTGGTLGVWAAAHPDLKEAVGALVLISPNFHPRDRNSRLVLLPWGEQIARVVVGPERCWEPENEAQARHWTTCYPTAALLPMMGLVERVRTLDLKQVTAPLLVLYSTRDQVVDPLETETHFARFGSEHKRLISVEGSQDPAQHILAGAIMSPGTTDRLVEETMDFLAASGMAPEGSGS